MASIIFMGTPDFAVPTLIALHKEFGVCAVVTVPDKPQGRGLQLQASAVKRAAIELGITTILQPNSLKDEQFQQELYALEPDIMCVVAFRILPAQVYSMARKGAFNIHGSLLPKYRGAAPINWAIIRGEEQTGVTSFLLADKVDTGTMIDRRVVPITDTMTAGELHDALMPRAAELAVQTTHLLLGGTIYPEEQNDAQATTAPKIFRAMCVIDWTQSAIAIRNFIHGLSPSPGAWTLLDGKPCKILRAVVDTQHRHIAPGEYHRYDMALHIGCSTGSLCIVTIQPEGKKVMAVEDFLRGWRSAERGMLG
jgi:methionyl-tRNA formyltransferase